jgi:membrane protein insertase Oxa1/YidC/SpoIIIJ
MGNLSKISLVYLSLFLPIGLVMTMFASNPIQILVSWLLCGIGGYAFGALLAKNN